MYNKNAANYKIEMKQTKIKYFYPAGMFPGIALTLGIIGLLIIIVLSFAEYKIFKFLWYKTANKIGFRILAVLSLLVYLYLILQILIAGGIIK